MPKPNAGRTVAWSNNLYQNRERFAYHPIFESNHAYSELAYQLIKSLLGLIPLLICGHKLCVTKKENVIQHLILFEFLSPSKLGFGSSLIYWTAYLAFLDMHIYISTQTKPSFFLCFWYSPTLIFCCQISYVSFGPNRLQEEKERGEGFQVQELWRAWVSGRILRDISEKCEGLA